MNVLPALASVTLLFMVFLVFREFLGRLKEIFCVICASVFVTWLGLLALYKLGRFQNTILLAILIGESTLGIYYLADSGLRLGVFRLPFLLSLILAGYSLVEMPSDILGSMALLILLWVIFGIIFVFRKSKRMLALVKRIVECCRNW